MNNDIEQLREAIGGILMSPNNLIIPRHSHTGQDSPKLDPANFLGWPAIQVSDATTAPTDTPQTGTFRFYVDTTPHYYLWTYLAYTSAGTITGAWKGINLAGTTTTNPTVHVYTSGTNTWTKPAGLTYAIVETEGGGGKGAAGGTTRGGNGGGGGGYARKLFAASALSATETATVGAGSTGTGGGTSSFKTVSATGGADSSGINGGAGGVGSGGDLNSSGGLGALTYPTSNGGDGKGPGGFSVLGYGIGGAGGGESGGSTPGDNGSAGVVIIYEYYN